jgi:ubiquinone/menaquinone biosynthesis C-methylase UbiE
MPYYPAEPADGRHYTRRYDRFYARFAKTYDWLVRLLPTWRGWLDHCLPLIEGPRVLEVSFGTGYLLSRYAGDYQTYGVDYNTRLASLARHNLARSGLSPWLQIADVAALPYAAESFDSVVNTMAFTGYPDGVAALAEMHRVLKPGGRLILVDVNYPLDGSRLGTLATRLWIAAGDLVREMGPLFEAQGLDYEDRVIGGWGSVHLYLAHKASAGK